MLEIADTSAKTKINMNFADEILAKVVKIKVSSINDSEDVSDINRTVSNK